MVTFKVILRYDYNLQQNVFLAIWLYFLQNQIPAIEFSTISLRISLHDMSFHIKAKNSHFSKKPAICFIIEKSNEKLSRSILFVRDYRHPLSIKDFEWYFTWSSSKCYRFLRIRKPIRFREAGIVSYSLFRAMTNIKKGVLCKNSDQLITGHYFCKTPYLTCLISYGMFQRPFY